MRMREAYEAKKWDVFCENNDLRLENDQLKAENAKLRELVRDMWREGAFEPGACYVYEADKLEERTRELGIEVDELGRQKDNTGD